MPQVSVAIGGREFEVACQDGEEHYLQSAAAMLNEEAEHLSSQIGRMPESRMLLMAGLMLADKTAVLDEKVKEANNKMAQMQAQIETLQNAQLDQVGEVPAVVTASMAELTARAEALADMLEAKS